MDGEEAVTAGGAYTALLTFRPQDDLLLPVLSEIKAK